MKIEVQNELSKKKPLSIRKDTVVALRVKTSLKAGLGSNPGSNGGSI